MVFEYSDCRIDKRQGEKTSAMKILPEMLLPLISKEILVFEHFNMSTINR